MLNKAQATELFSSMHSTIRNCFLTNKQKFTAIKVIKNIAFKFIMNKIHVIRGHGTCEMRFSGDATMRCENESSDQI